MKNITALLTLALCLAAPGGVIQSKNAEATPHPATNQATLSPSLIEKGVSKELAEHRKAHISKVVYDLSFDIPAAAHEPVSGKAVISFMLDAPQDVILDFQGTFDGGSYAYIEKKKGKSRRVPIDATYRNEHIILPMEAMREGRTR